MLNVFNLEMWVKNVFFLPHNVLAQPAICSSADSFEGVDGSFKWPDNEAWERSDLFNNHEHDGRIAQTMRKKANLVYRSYCVMCLVARQCSS